MGLCESESFSMWDLLHPPPPTFGKVESAYICLLFGFSVGLSVCYSYKSYSL